MRRRHLLCVCVAFILLMAIAATISNLVGRRGGLDLSGNDPVVIKPQTRAFLAQVKGRVSLTYFVSSKDKVPASMKDVEPTMRDLLEALRQAAPDTIDISVIDPDFDKANGPAYASRKGIAAVKTRRVRFDAASEQAVWSGLDIAFNDYPNAVIPFITEAELPYMQDLVVSNLMMMAHPVPAVVGVSAPAEGFTEIPKVISSIPLTSAVRIDFEKTAALPPMLDLFIWVAPRRIEERHLRELERFIDAGRSIVIAGSEHNVICARDVATSSCRVERSPYDFNALVRTFGLSARSEVVVDTPASQPVKGVPFPLHLPAALTDIRALHGFSIGELHLSSVSALELDPDLLRRSGFEAQIVSTTSAETKLLADAPSVFGQEALRKAIPVPKQPWVVRLTPSDPWRGGVLVIGTASVLSDPFMKASDNSNTLLLKAAVETFTARDRLGRLRVERHLPQELPVASPMNRFVWRALVIGAVPVLLLLIGAIRGGGRPRLPRGVVWGAPLRRALVACVVIVVISGFLETRPLAPIIASSSSPMKSAPYVASLLSRLPQPVDAELIISPQRYWPASLKDVEREIRAALRGLGIPYRVVAPELLSKDDQRALGASGIEPFTIERIEGDETIRATVWAALRFTTPTRATTIPAIEPRMLQDLQFLIGAALTRLERGTAGPVVGFVSDVPKLTSAQAYAEYTQMGYTPPEGSNPFGEVGNLLKRYGYQVRALNPKDPIFDQDLDLVVWLQPRAPVERLSRFAEYMARGGRAFVALQQYKVKQRQYRGGGYTTVYWPEPQTHRFNEYLKLLGISQTGEKTEAPAEILLDRNQGRLALDTRVYQRSRYREMLKQEVVRPFLIRAVGSGLSPISPITDRLGALLYIWGNRFTVDETKLTENKLTATTLVHTSERPWTYTWSGGWIPEPALSEPSPEQYLQNAVPLAVRIRGSFPTASNVESDPRNPLREGPANTTPSPGELIVSSSSEMFTDANIYLEGYQHDRFLLNSVATLAYETEMANLQARPAYTESFAAPSRALTLAWRVCIVGGAPLVLMMYGVWRVTRRRIARRG